MGLRTDLTYHNSTCPDMREKLASLETHLLMLEHSGSGRGMTYRLSRRASAILNEGVAYDMTRRLDREAIKVRILFSA